MGVRQLPEGEQGLLEPRYTVMLVSRDDLPLAELVRGHRSQQGQENARKGPLTDLGRHHPPGKSYQAHQAFHWCGQIAQLLLRRLPYQLRPGAARRHGLRPLLSALRAPGGAGGAERAAAEACGRGAGTCAGTGCCTRRASWNRPEGRPHGQRALGAGGGWGAAGVGARVRRRPGLAASVVGGDTPETGLGPGESVW